MNKISPVKFFKSLYYANTNKIPHKIKPRPYSENSFEDIPPLVIKKDFYQKIFDFCRNLFK